MTENIESKAAEIADQVVPQYRKKGGSYSCSSHTARRWSAAANAAAIALGRTMPADDLQSRPALMQIAFLAAEARPAGYVMALERIERIARAALAEKGDVRVREKSSIKKVLEHADRRVSRQSARERRTAEVFLRPISGDPFDEGPQRIPDYE